MPNRINPKREAGMEWRSYPVNVRKGSADTLSLEGYAAVFNQETVLVKRDAWYKGSPEIREKIDAGAFTKTLKHFDQRAVWNHNTDIVLGRRKNDTLKLSEDEHGLKVEIMPPNNQYIRDVVIAPIDRGDVDQMSFGFRVVRDEVLDTREMITITLKEVDLLEVSPVAIPAYAGTEIGLSSRSMDRIEEFRQLRADESEDSTPSHNLHPGGEVEPSGPPEKRHLDEDLHVLIEREKCALV